MIIMLSSLSGGSLGSIEISRAQPHTSGLSSGILKPHSVGDGVFAPCFIRAAFGLAGLFNDESQIGNRKIG
jgi:hypothetical protein